MRGGGKDFRAVPRISEAFPKDFRTWIQTFRAVLGESSFSELRRASSIILFAEFRKLIILFSLRSRSATMDLSQLLHWR